MRVGSAGTHPFSLFERQRITARDRYRNLVDQLQYVARRELIFGLHIHVAVDDPEKAIKVVNGLLAHLSSLLALSASSPFWRGEPTGLASSRQMVFAAFPRSGPPPRFSDYADYAEVVGQLEKTGCIADYTHIWWDIRLHPRFGTSRSGLRRGHESRGRGRAGRVVPGARQALLRATTRSAARSPSVPSAS
jgi:carboxylate-amine ligase